MRHHRLLIANCLLLLTLLCSYWGRRTEGVTLSGGDFLAPLSLPFRDWKVTEDRPLTSAERSLLEPDAVLLREYTAPDGQTAQLAVIAGHRKRSVHTPAFCLAGGGWDTLYQHSEMLPLTTGKIPIVRSLMRHDNAEWFVTYFFTDGEYSTNNLLQFQGTQLVKRFRAELPLGALVRIIVPIQNGEKANAEALTHEFAQTMAPPVMEALRKARRRIP